MLISQGLPQRIFKDLALRNALIQKYNRLPTDDPNLVYKKILIFWLGSNIELAKIKVKDDKVKDKFTPFLCAGYYCFLILDKAYTSVEPQTKLGLAVQALQVKLLTAFNRRYKLILSNPRHLFNEFIEILKNPPPDLTSAEKTQYQIMIKACLDEINRALSNEQLFEPLASTVQVKNFKGLTRRINATLSGRHPLPGVSMLHPFYSSFLSYKDITKNNLYKIILETPDRALLDGLFLGGAIKTEDIILTLIGHFQSEHFYLCYNLEDFHKLFNRDIFFIHHRNFSLRSNKVANKLLDMAHDVVQYVDYFQKHYKNVVLYGMCGGTPHMILAANILKERGQAVKLIVDRAPTKYELFFDFKTLRRLQSAVKYPPPLFRTVSYLPIILLILFFGLIIRLLLSVTGNNINFADILRQQPETDVLILQGKSKKANRHEEPTSTDLLVHPHNDLRFAVKDRRHKNKNILKELITVSSAISSQSRNQPVLKEIFSRLAIYFNECLQLIDNEKLLLETPNPKKDIHTHKLFELNTRHKLNLSTFLQGFFTKPIKVCDEPLTRLLIAELDLENPVLALPPKLVDNLFLFLFILDEHKNFIIHMGNRLHTTGLGNLGEVFGELMATNLFKKPQLNLQPH